MNDNSDHNGYATAPDGDESTTAAAPSGPAVDLLGGDFDSPPPNTDNVSSGPATAAVGASGSTGDSVMDILGVGDDSGRGAAGGEAGGGASNKSGGGGLDDFLGMGESSLGMEMRRYGDDTIVRRCGDVENGVLIAHAIYSDLFSFFFFHLSVSLSSLSFLECSSASVYPRVVNRNLGYFHVVATAGSSGDQLMQSDEEVNKG